MPRFGDRELGEPSRAAQPFKGPVERPPEIPSVTRDDHRPVIDTVERREHRIVLDGFHVDARVVEQRVAVRQPEPLRQMIEHRPECEAAAEAGIVPAVDVDVRGDLVTVMRGQQHDVGVAERGEVVELPVDERTARDVRHALRHQIVGDWMESGAFPAAENYAEHNKCQRTACIPST